MKLKTNYTPRLLVSAPLGIFVVFLPYLVSEDGVTGATLLVILSAVQLSPLIFGIAFDSINYLSITTALHYLGYTLAKLQHLSDSGKQGLPPSTIREIEEITICYLIVTASYLTLRFITRMNGWAPKISFGEQITLLSRRATHVIGLTGAFGLVAFRFLPTEVARPAAAFFHMIVIVAVLSSSEVPRLLRFYQALIVLSVGYSFVESASMGHGLIIGTCLFTGWLLTMQKHLLKFLLVIVFLGIIFQPIKGMLRIATWSGRELPIDEKLQVTLDVMNATYLGGDSTAILKKYEIEVEGTDQRQLDARKIALAQRQFVDLSEIELDEISTADILLTFLSRVADDSLERVMEMTPSQVPFKNGSTYENILFSFIPRFLWKDKPQWQLGLAFGHDYGYLNDDDMNTSIAFSYLAEGYMNFGYPGLYSAAVFFGLLLALAELVALRAVPSAALPVYFFMLLPMGSYANDATALFQTFIIHLAALYLIRPILARYTAKDSYHSTTVESPQY